MTSTARKGYTVEDYRALSHLTAPQAAAQLGVSIVTVRRIAKYHGFAFASAFGSQQRARAEDQRARYAALVHLSPSEVAVAMKVTIRTVEQAAARYGLTFAPERRAAAVRRPGPVPQVVEAVEPAPRRVSPSPAPAEPAPMPMAAAPDWTADRDALIVATKGRLAEIAALAARWSMPTARVMARWHVVRAR